MELVYSFLLHNPDDSTRYVRAYLVGYDDYRDDPPVDYWGAAQIENAIGSNVYPCKSVPVIKENWPDKDWHNVVPLHVNALGMFVPFEVAPESYRILYVHIVNGGATNLPVCLRISKVGLLPGELTDPP